jgi:DNA-nicking Smr family endonuclease
MRSPKRGRTALPTDDELALFHRAVSGAKPLQHDRVHHEPPPPRPIPRQSQLDDRAVLDESLAGASALELALEGGDEPAFQRPGVGRNVLRDLRRGRWVVQDEIDLHGTTRAEAPELLAAFVAQALRRGLRCVRVIHGKGLGSPRREPVLKTYVRAWLARREEVLAYCQARAVEGGAGAVVVLIRAPR